MRIVSHVGNRPQFVKAAPLCIALRAQGEEILVHSGQHYDPELADLFFDELGIPSPDHALDVGPGTPVHQIAIMMERFEHVVRDEKPDAVLVSGDTTTTLAGALVAAKCGIPLAHVEAGLRSFDKTMPEEQNRVVTDHLSDVLLCPTRQAVDNLAAEGITRGVHLVGDVMFDAGRMFAPLADDALFATLQASNRGPLPAAAIRGIFRQILSAARLQVKTVRVAYLGPAYSYTHIAAIERFGESADLVPVTTIAAVFEEVNRGQANYGIVPIENSTDGRIVDTLDMFTRLPLRICGEVQIAIHHNLLARSPRSEVTEIYSKPQALSQVSPPPTARR